MANLSLPAALKSYRRRAMLTQAELAAQLGVSLYSVRAWEGGKWGISARNARRLRELGVKFVW